MDYIEKAKEEIETEWFKDHVATIKGQEGLRVLYWKTPGTRMYEVKYVLSGSNVFISGDIGDAVYQLTCGATLENIKDFNLGYFTGKLTALEGDRWKFDEKYAKQQLKEYWKDIDLEGWKDAKEVYDGIESAINEATTFNNYQAWLMPVYQNYDCHDHLESVWDFGQRLPYQIIAYWVGLQMAIKQLNQN